MSLFPSRAPGSDRNAGTVLYKFKAGKMIMSAQQPNGKFNVTPDSRRGLVTISRSGDGVVHFKWENAQTGAVEDDHMVFSGENVFKKVNTGRPNDRVCMLKYNSGSQRHMYWMQELSSEKDEEAVTKVNEYIANPNAPSSIVPPPSAAGPAAGGAGLPPAPAGVNPDEWAQLLNMAGLGGGGGRAPAAATVPAAARPAPASAGTTASVAAPTSSSVAAPALGGLDFNSLLSGLPAPAPSAESHEAAASSFNAATGDRPPTVPSSTQPAVTIEDLRRAMGLSTSGGTRPAAVPSGARRACAPTLRDVLSTDEILRTGLLSDPTVQAELRALLPEEETTVAAAATTEGVARLLESTLRSAQLQQSVHALDRAIAEPQNYNSIMSNFGIDPQPGTAQLYQGDTTAAFLTALSAAHPPSEPAAAAAAADSTSSTSAPGTIEDEDSGSGPMEK